MVMMDQMTQLMYHHIIHDPMRCHNNLPVITDLTSGITTTPPTLVFLNLDLSRLDTHLIRIFASFLFQFVDGTMQIPVSELLSD